MVVWNGFISEICIPNMKSLSLVVERLWASLKSCPQTDWEAKSCHSGGIKCIRIDTNLFVYYYSLLLYMYNLDIWGPWPPTGNQDTCAIYKLWAMKCWSSGITIGVTYKCCTDHLVNNSDFVLLQSWVKEKETDKVAPKYANFCHLA